MGATANTDTFLTLPARAASVLITAGASDGGLSR
jgi:hypothetical protein